MALLVVAPLVIAWSRPALVVLLLQGLVYNLYKYSVVRQVNHGISM